MIFADGKTIMYEKSFLKDVAYQHFAKYDVQYRLKTPVIVSMIGSTKKTKHSENSFVFLQFQILVDCCLTCKYVVT